MDVSGEDLIHFWRTLTKNHVRYIMVGGFATRFHGFNRSTDDLDIWLQDTLENRRNLRRAFVELGYGDFEELERVEFVPGFSGFYIGGGIELDIMTQLKGLENLSFEECLGMASVAELDDVKVPFLHLNHLIANKKMVNRPKDQVDIIELEKIRRIREDEARGAGR